MSRADQVYNELFAAEENAQYQEHSCNASQNNSRNASQSNSRNGSRNGSRRNSLGTGERYEDPGQEPSFLAGKHSKPFEKARVQFVYPQQAQEEPHGKVHFDAMDKSDVFCVKPEQQQQRHGLKMLPAALGHKAQMKTVMGYGDSLTQPTFGEYRPHVKKSTPHAPSLMTFDPLASSGPEWQPSMRRKTATRQSQMAEMLSDNKGPMRTNAHLLPVKRHFQLEGHAGSLPLKMEFGDDGGFVPRNISQMHRRPFQSRQAPTNPMQLGAF